jgi:hypothetical protein
MRARPQDAKKGKKEQRKTANYFPNSATVVYLQPLKMPPLIGHIFLPQLSVNERPLLEQ